MKKSGNLGFGGTGNDKQDKQLLVEALCDYGISRQLLGRCTAFITLHDPSVNELLRILDFGQGILASYNQLLAQTNMSIALSGDSKLAIAQYAYETRTFARGMKRIVSSLIEDVVYSGTQGKVEVSVGDVMTVIDHANTEIPESVREEGIMTKVDNESEPTSSCGN